MRRLENLAEKRRRTDHHSGERTKRTAANSVGSIEIDCEVVLVRRTRPRSETAAITQSAATVQTVS